MKLGTIRKRAELSLQRRLGFVAPQEQLELAREYAPRVVEGTISLDDAVREILLNRYDMEPEEMG